MTCKSRQNGTYLYRGRIKTITLHEGTITIGYVWLAKFVDGIWYLVQNRDYLTDTTLSLFQARRDGVLTYQTTIVGEMGALFPSRWTKPLRKPIIRLEE